MNRISRGEAGDGGQHEQLQYVLPVLGTKPRFLFGAAGLSCSCFSPKAPGSWGVDQLLRRL
ncbi:hypothetical protein [Paenibacillus kobensis]|uniref:hypothetical protein n=1 Tax=Paenibacillus kobensis TaxID=59841 RepID=UPI000FDC1442|nr:hypothetical protein [Paenibacillus kobensis]